MNFKHTLKQPIQFTGSGVHTGLTANVIVRPADDKFGIRFKRTDLPNKPEIKALVSNVTTVERATTLEKDGGKVHTTEHLLAALYASGIDNALIEIDNEEVPILDGGAKEFMQAIEAAGLEKQKTEQEIFYLDNNLHFQDEHKFFEVVALPSQNFQLSVNIEYGNSILNHQHAELNNLTNFAEKIAPARTFCLLSELSYLVDNNLVKGGSLDNAVVFVDKQISDEQKERLSSYFNLKDIIVEKGETLNKVPLHFSNEPARHKLLDFIGDLSLLGARFNARIYASRPGHSVNVAFVKHLKELIQKKQNIQKLPPIDLNSEPLMGIHEIEKQLPHRYPFLLIDKVFKLEEDEVIACKNVTFNEQFFQGHFPGNALMPGVLQIEAMAQTGGILVLNTVPDPQNYWTIFLKIDDAKFRSPVKPGDTVVFQMKLLKPIRRGICEMRGTAFVGGKIATEATLTAQIVRKNV